MCPATTRVPHRTRFCYQTGNVICKSRVQDIWGTGYMVCVGVLGIQYVLALESQGTRLAKDTTFVRITSCALLKLTIAQYTFPISDT